MNTQDSQHLLQTNKTPHYILECWRKYGKNEKIPF